MNRNVNCIENYIVKATRWCTKRTYLKLSALSWCVSEGGDMSPWNLLGDCLLIKGTSDRKEGRRVMDTKETEERDVFIRWLDNGVVNIAST